MVRVMVRSQHLSFQSSHIVVQQTNYHIMLKLHDFIKDPSQPRRQSNLRHLWRPLQELTFWMEDFPLRLSPINNILGFSSDEKPSSISASSTP